MKQLKKNIEGIIKKIQNSGYYKSGTREETGCIIRHRLLVKSWVYTEHPFTIKTLRSTFMDTFVSRNN
jgi:hypothetical protein